jgi:hypothetical protein
MKKITLYNDFHATAVNLRIADGHNISAWQCRKARRALCGMVDCCCGNDLGQRGPQYLPEGMEIIPTMGKDGEITARINI